MQHYTLYVEQRKNLEGGGEKKFKVCRVSDGYTWQKVCFAKWLAQGTRQKEGFVEFPIYDTRQTAKDRHRPPSTCLACATYAEGRKSALAKDRFAEHSPSDTRQWMDDCRLGNSPVHVNCMCEVFPSVRSLTLRKPLMAGGHPNGRVHMTGTWFMFAEHHVFSVSLPKCLPSASCLSCVGSREINYLPCVLLLPSVSIGALDKTVFFCWESNDLHSANPEAQFVFLVVTVYCLDLWHIYRNWKTQPNSSTINERKKSILLLSHIHIVHLTPPN